MRLALGILVLILSTYIGYMMSKKYTVRKAYYNAFTEFNKKLKNEISFRQQSLLTLIRNFGNENCFYTALKDVIVEKKSFNLDDKVFNEDEQTFLSNYLAVIGKGDRLSQLKYVESVEVQIAECLKNANDDEKKYKVLFIKLGFLIGLMLLVVLL